MLTSPTKGSIWSCLPFTDSMTGQECGRHCMVTVNLDVECRSRDRDIRSKRVDYDWHKQTLAQGPTAFRVTISLSVHQSMEFAPTEFRMIARRPMEARLWQERRRRFRSTANELNLDLEKQAARSQGVLGRAGNGRGIRRFHRVGQADLKISRRLQYPIPAKSTAN